MRSLISPSASNTIVDKLKTYEGGLGVDNAAAAVVVLDAVPLSSLGQPNGVAGLDASGKLYADNIPDAGIPLVHVNGPNNVNVSANGTFTITNYDMFTTYNITAIAGSFTRNKETITYTAPSTAGAGGFIINGRTINVTINGMAPNKPTLAISHSKGTNNKALATMTGSAFSMNFGANTHLNTDWEISTVSDFSTIAFSSLANATNKTTVSIDGLELSTTYYGRVRYRDNQNNTSAYSDVFTFTTSAVYSISIEEAKIFASDKLASDNFGRSVSIDANGDRVVIASPYSDPVGVSEAGSIYVFLRTGNSWTQEAKITNTFYGIIANERFGWSVDMDATGTRIVVGILGYSSNRGAACVFVRSGTTWSNEQRVLASDGASGFMLGSSVAIDSTGTRIIVGSEEATSGGLISAGQAYVFVRSGSSWSQESILIASDRAATDKFGYSVDIDSTGTRAVVGSFMADVSGNGNAGAVYVFLRSGITWTQEQKITATTPAVNNQFGWSVCIDSTGTRIAVGVYQATSGGVSEAGVVEIFSRNVTTWSSEAIVSASDKVSLDRFGWDVSFDENANYLVSSVPLSDPDGIGSAGAIYLFTRNGVNWNQTVKLSASDKAASDLFGMSVHISANGSRVVVGANGEDPGGTTDGGSAYIFRA